MWEGALISTAALEVRIMGGRRPKSLKFENDRAGDAVEVWSCDDDGHVSAPPRPMKWKRDRTHSIITKPGEME